MRIQTSTLLAAVLLSNPAQAQSAQAEIQEVVASWIGYPSALAVVMVPRRDGWNYNASQLENFARLQALMDAGLVTSRQVTASECVGRIDGDPVCEFFPSMDVFSFSTRGLEFVLSSEGDADVSQRRVVELNLGEIAAVSVQGVSVDSPRTPGCHAEVAVNYELSNLTEVGDMFTSNGIFSQRVCMLEFGNGWFAGSYWPE